MVFRNLGEEIQIQREMAEQRKADEAKAQELERVRQADSARRQARRQVINRRFLDRDTPPQDYAPGDISALEMCVATNQPYCVGMRIHGDNAGTCEINLDLEAFNLDKSSFENVSFGRDANLESASLRGATFIRVVFASRANLSKCDFSECQFIGVTFEEEAVIERAIFDFASFDKDTVIEFDSNRTLNSLFPNGRKDRWSKLSQSYSRTWQLVSVLLSGSYLGIVVAKLHLFGAIARLQASHPHVMKAMLDSGERLREVSAAEFVFGASGVSILLPSLVLLFQLLRLFVTTRVGPLIDEESRTGYTPLRTAVLRWAGANRWVTWLGWLALSFFLYELVSLFRLSIVTPT